ncbi:MAG: exo-alpha-sialidase [Ignavibacteria bacterium]|jgi:hypothetical protein
MKNKISNNFVFNLPASIFLIVILTNCVQNEQALFYVTEGLFDFSQPETLGLETAPGTETFTIFSPAESTDKYSHGVALIGFKGSLYAQWQSSEQDEDAPDTKVVYSRSSDGANWTEPVVLAPAWENGISTSGGWRTYDDTLIAYINKWPKNLNPRGGYTEYVTSPDGINWSEPRPLTMKNGSKVKGVFEQDPHALPDGRIINAVHEQPGMIVSPYYTDDPKGIGGWVKGKMQNLPFEGTVSREIEPSWFYQSNGNIVMIFRDQASTYKKLASVSNDRGETWSAPVITNMPDARTKQSAGNFPDGTAFMVGNPNNNKQRIPLVITLSKDGILFNKAYLLRKGGEDLQPLRFKGLYKRAGYSYPKSYIWKDYLYVSYATNKEDVQVTRVPLLSLKKLIE